MNSPYISNFPSKFESLNGRPESQCQDPPALMGRPGQRPGPILHKEERERDIEEGEREILHKAAVVSHASFPRLSLGRNERRATREGEREGEEEDVCVLRPLTTTPKSFIWAAADAAPDEFVFRQLCEGGIVFLCTFE